MANTSAKWKSVLLILTFLITEYFLQGSIETLGTYAIYIGELILVSLFFIIFNDHELQPAKPDKSGFALLSSLLVMGFLSRALAGTMGIIIPFDFHSTETLIFLLAVGPLLEELLFRGLLHRTFQELLENTVATSVITSLMFSYSHFQAYFKVPADFQPFIFYQTGYTFLLALLCTIVRIRHGLIWAILAHALFNFGFYLGN